MAAVQQIGIGVIGCGMISNTYLPNLTQRYGAVKLVGVADLVEEKARKAAEKYNCAYMTNDEIYNCPDIQIVVNLTNVWSHHEVTKAALEHGKHVYCEKMAAETFEEAKELYDLAQEKGLMFAMAPDTFLGGGYQTCRWIIDQGLIGEPFAADAKIIRTYQLQGAMPMKSNINSEGGTIPFDMGGYYIHALQCMFGPVKRVGGFARWMKKEYTNPKNPMWKEENVLKSPNLIVGTLEHYSGVLSTLTAGDSGVMNNKEIPGIWVYGTGGTLFCPDPNTFGCPVKIFKPGYDDFMEVPLTHGFSGLDKMMRFGPAPANEDFMVAMWADSRRGIGVGDMCWALINKRPARITNEMGLHSIEIINAMVQCTKTNKIYEMTTKPIRPVALRAGFMAADQEAVFDDYWDETVDTTPWWCK